MKSMIAMSKLNGKMLIVHFHDIEKYVDKEMVEDAILTCIKCKVDPKAVRIWYKLNDATRIKV